MLFLINNNILYAEPKNCELLEIYNNTPMMKEEYLIIPFQMINQNVILYFENIDTITTEDILLYITDIHRLSDFLIWLEWPKIEERIIHDISINGITEQNANSINYLSDKTKIPLRLDSLKSLSKHNIQISQELADLYTKETNLGVYYKISNINKIKQKINTLLTFDLTWTDDMFIAGGLLVDILNNETKTDFDINIYVTNNNGGLFSHMLQNIPKPFYTKCNGRRIEIRYSKIRIQIILSYYNNPIDLMNTFDLDICKVAMTTNSMYIHNFGYYCIRNKCLTSDMIRVTGLMKKYIARGFVFVGCHELRKRKIRFPDLTKWDKIIDPIELNKYELVPIHYNNDIHEIDNDTITQNETHIILNNLLCTVKLYTKTNLTIYFAPNDAKKLSELNLNENCIELRTVSWFWTLLGELYYTEHDYKFMPIVMENVLVCGRINKRDSHYCSYLQIKYNNPTIDLEHINDNNNDIFYDFINGLSTCMYDTDTDGSNISDDLS